ncbi:MAG: hypothetical protein PWP65_1735 [Clostridia bacterium]|nr:hypothetical protein [Clostridia bacterium]
MFRAAEIFAFALAIEKNGRDFYLAMSAAAEEEAVKKLFNRLAAEEEQHIQDFKKLGEQAAVYDPPETYPGEYEAYMQALIASSVFSKELKPEELTRAIKTDHEALNLALSLEKDAILFFSGLANLISSTEVALVQELLRQERRHLYELQGAIATLGYSNVIKY